MKAELIFGFGTIAFLLGAVIGTSEIVSRYRDAPGRALQTGSAWLYISLNAAASLCAFALVRNIDVLKSIGGETEGVGKALVQSLVAGLSAMALFRSSLFMVRVGNTDIGIGPAAFLQILLAATDRATDRARAKPRADAVREIMGGISFALAKEALPSLCFGLMQGVTSEEEVTFGVGVKALETSTMEDSFKANSLGLRLMNLVGEDVLRQAVNMLRADISAKPKPIVQSILTLKLLQSARFDARGRAIVEGCLFVANKMQDEKLTLILNEALTKIAGLPMSQQQKILLLSGQLVVFFGENTVQYVLKSLQEHPESVDEVNTQPTREASSVQTAAMPSPKAGPEQIDSISADSNIVQLPTVGSSGSDPSAVAVSNPGGPAGQI